MESSSKTTHTIILDEDERQWLLEILQNPIYGELTCDEDPRDKKYREIFWEALNDTVPSFGSIPEPVALPIKNVGPFGAPYGSSRDEEPF